MPFAQRPANKGFDNNEQIEKSELNSFRWLSMDDFVQMKVKH